ncbi:chemotaxis protein CheW [Corticibacter populi]|uniref:Chemotaxis protein CheW n=1 Tax=Corticibacter populi TaxID=1550736 RepID=A0A3M6QIU3_9BURK|nr:chemotaxis protein CheW [Corticibacter populi]RMX02947.1 chemotaxis protein CheW [Corticibacter populi]RZS33363.1 twitching motility protein PilI [Corticibacter populi]
MSSNTARTEDIAQTNDQALQERLAKRIRQASQGEQALPSWLAVEIGARSCLVPLNHASELFPWQMPHPVPYVQPWFLGAANLRGELTGVVDLGLFIGDAASRRTEQSLAECKLLTFNPVLEINVALLIDRVAGLKSVNDFSTAYAPAPADSDQQPFLGNAYRDTAGRIWRELNLQSLSQDSRFLSIRL